MKIIERKSLFVVLMIVSLIASSITVTAEESKPVDGTYAHGNKVQFTDVDDYANGKVTSSNYFGGSDQIDVATSDLEVTDKIQFGLNDIFAGGLDKKVDNTKIVINGPWQDAWKDNTTTASASGYWVFGGGKGDFASSESTNIIMNSGLVRGYLIGGGSTGATIGTTNIVLNGGQVGKSGRDTAGQGEIYGGGNDRSVVTGDTNITINGGTVQQHIVGGGLGAGSDVQGSSNIVINNGTFKGSIAGGGGNKSNVVYGDSNIEIYKGDTQLDGGVNARKIVGGGYWTSNLVKGTANIMFKLDENDFFKASIYGAGGIRTDTNYPMNEVGAVNIQLLSGLLDGSVYGGGYKGSILGDTEITLNGSNVSGSIYGGSYMGGVTQDSDIYLKNGTVGANVHGVGGNVDMATVYTEGDAKVHVYPNAQVNGNIVASSTKAKVQVKKEARVIFHDMNNQDGFLTTYVDKEIQAGTSSNTVMEFNNFTALNSAIIGKTAERFAKIEFNNNTNVYLSNVLNRYFGNNWIIDATSKVFMDENQTIDALNVLNMGTIALVKDANKAEFKELGITGSYTGDNGNLEMSAKAVGSTDYFNITKEATGSTTLKLSLADKTWDGTDLDLIEAEVTNSDASAFAMKPFACTITKNGKDVQGMATLRTRTDDQVGRRYWYLSFSEAPEVNIDGSKIIKGINTSSREFTFEALPVNEQGESLGQSAISVKRTGAGDFTFKLGQYNEGTYYFNINEVIEEHDNWIYDETNQMVKVVVAYDEQNDEYNVTYDPTKISFTNTYREKADEPYLNIKGKKEIEGIDVTLEKFTFEALPVDENGVSLGQKALTVTRKGAGNFTINLGQYSEGTYYFKVKEVAEDIECWTFDDTEYLVKVVVSYDKKTNTYKIDYDPELVVFTNTYIEKAAAPEINLVGTKVIKGIDSTSQEFTFEALPVNKDGVSIGKKAKTVTQTGAGDFTIDLGVYEEGTHYFKVSELVKEVENWTFDKTEYLIKVTVMYDKNSNTYNVKYDDTNIVFTNTYVEKASTPEVKLSGTKIVKGLDTTTEEFTFEALPVDEKGNALGQKAVSVTQTGAGDFTINLGQYEEGTHYFKVSELAKEVDNWTFDKTEYLVKVTVTYDKKSNTYNVEYDDTSIIFTNTYVEKASTPEVKLSGTKIVKGLDTTTEEFTFEALPVDEKGNALGQKAVSVTQTGAGDFTINLGQYEEGTHYFKVSELSKEVDNWTFDKTEYLVKVTVTYDKKSNTYNVKYDDTNIVFTNTYVDKTSAPSLSLTGTKYIKGLDKTTEEFIFNAILVDEKGNALGQEVVSVKQTGAGEFVLDLGQYEEGTHYFRVSETLKEVSNWTFDKTEYVVKVVVAYDKTTNEYSVTYDDTEIFFVNVYDKKDSPSTKPNEDPQKPIMEAPSIAPNTGDTVNVQFFAVLLFGGFGLALLLVLKKRNAKTNK